MTFVVEVSNPRNEVEELVERFAPKDSADLTSRIESETGLSITTCAEAALDVLAGDTFCWEDEESGLVVEAWRVEDDQHPLLSCGARSWS
jgi:hypothetical protein